VLFRVTLAAIAIHALLVGSVASANTDVVVDAQGDVAASVPAPLDIVQAKITEQLGKGVLFFHMELAGLPPETPAAPHAYVWNIHVPGGAALDYTVTVRGCFVTVVGCGSGPAHWASLLVDFSTTPPTLTPSAFSFKIQGATVKAYVDPTLLGDPTGFDWSAYARIAPPSIVPQPVDRAPDSGLTAFVR
jgi:hypothetical protein